MADEKTLAVILKTLSQILKENLEANMQDPGRIDEERLDALRSVTRYDIPHHRTARVEAEATLGDEILARAKMSSNERVRMFVEQFAEKVDVAGPAGGRIYEGFWEDFEKIQKKPEGLLADFTPGDFEELKRVLFG